MAEKIEITVDLDTWHCFAPVLRSALENTQELLDLHTLSHGDTTKKNRCITDMYCKELDAIRSLLKYLEANNGVPF